MEGYTTFRAGDEILCLPNDLIDSWTPAQKRWADAPRAARGTPELERLCKVGAELYAARTSKFKISKVVPPRVLNKFQFWLRTELIRLGLI